MSSLYSILNGSSSWRSWLSRSPAWRRTASPKATSSSSGCLQLVRHPCRTSSSGSGGSTYSSKYEYPLATEPPEITRTKASEVAGTEFSRRGMKSSFSSASSGNLDGDPTSVMGSLSEDSAALIDRFDEQQKLSPSEVQSIRNAQKLYLSTKPVGTTPITKEVPPYVPPNVSSKDLLKPQTRITTLDNGIRVVSQNTYGQVSTVGVVCEMGSRTESTLGDHRNAGVTNVLEMLAFNSSTTLYDGQQITQSLQDYGGTRFASAGREQTLLCVDLLRPNVDKAVQLLQQVTLEPLFLDHEIEEAKMTLQYSLDSLPPDLLLGEALQMAAYGPDQQLGQRHFGGAESHDPASATPFLHNITSDTCRNYWTNQLLRNPKGIVIGGVGIEHDYLLELLQQHTTFGSLQQDDTNRSRVIPSQYRGGEHRVQLPDLFSNNDDSSSPNSSLPSMPIQSTIEERQMVKVAIAFEVDGWHQKNNNNSNREKGYNEQQNHDLVTVCVLQTLLGGGSSFSAGGPGKGMYSRLYRQILNRYSWAEAAEAFTVFHNESGLFGLTGTTHPYAVGDMTQVLCEHLLRLTTQLVSEEELSRARNMLKNNVLTQLESRLVLFEDISRQVLTYGYREEMKDTVQKIQSVTAEDILNLCQRTIRGSKPTVACVGIDLTNVPPLCEIEPWFQ